MGIANVRLQALYQEIAQLEQLEKALKGGNENVSSVWRRVNKECDLRLGSFPKKVTPEIKVKIHAILDKKRKSVSAIEAAVIARFSSRVLNVMGHVDEVGSRSALAKIFAEVDRISQRADWLRDSLSSGLAKMRINEEMWDLLEQVYDAAFPFLDEGERWALFDEITTAADRLVPISQELRAEIDKWNKLRLDEL